MPESTKTASEPVEKAVEAAEKPVKTWQRTIASAGAVVGGPWRRYRASVFQGYLVVAVIVFLVLAVLARTVPYFSFDLIIARAIQSVNAGWFNALMYALTWLWFSPQSTIISGVILVVLFASGLKWETAVMAISVIGNSALVSGIKLLVERPRPSADLVHVLGQLHDYSFPSGHVVGYMAQYGFLFFLAYTLLKKSWWRTALLVLFGGMVALIGPSRIYEGQHWPSDVLAAYLLGSLWLTALVLFYRWGKPRFFVNQPVAKETSRAT